MIQNYAAQYCAAKSLPFTAAEMALDCVSAALTTIANSGTISAKSITHLQIHGHKVEAEMMKRLKYVTELTDVGGKRKLDTSASGSNKRVRVRQHRTNIAKKVNKLGDRILSKKASYLESCPFVGLIVDEGNNWKRSCPVYAATISCDREFRWRVQFVGQADCEGKNNGESIFDLVKNIFIVAGLLAVYKKIVSAGTDGASVMRSSALYHGKWFMLFVHDIFVHIVNCF